MKHPVSIGKNIERIRKIRDMKQETLAEMIGVSRQTVSKIEQSDEVDEDRLEAIAKALDVPVSTIKNYTDEAVIINIQNMNDNSGVYNYHLGNPMDKIVKLYEELLKSEREKIALLKSLLEKQSDDKSIL